MRVSVSSTGSASPNRKRCEQENIRHIVPTRCKPAPSFEQDTDLIKLTGCRVLHVNAASYLIESRTFGGYIDLLVC